MSQMIQLDEPAPPPPVIHRIERSSTVNTVTGTLLITGSEPTQFQDFVRKYHNHRLVGSDGVFVYWGTYSRQKWGKDEFFNALNLQHVGWGTKTAGIMALTELGLLGKIVGYAGAATAQTVISIIDNVNVIRGHAESLGGDAPGPGKSPRELLHRKFRRGDILAGLLAPISRALGTADRYYLSFSARGPQSSNAPGIRGESSRMLLGASGSEVSFLLGDICSWHFA